MRRFARLLLFITLALAKKSDSVLLVNENLKGIQDISRRGGAVAVSYSLEQRSPQSPETLWVSTSLHLILA
jgi:hypothetical protein